MICFLVFLSACKEDDLSYHKQILPIQEKDVLLENINEDILWDEINEEGVNEELLIERIDRNDLEYIANELQTLCKKMDEKGEKDRGYWLTGEWYIDVFDSDEYHHVISLGDSAMKPLFLILYKSEKAGLYEWICSKALEELSGYDFNSLNNGAGWRNAEEFLEAFISRIQKENKT